MNVLSVNLNRDYRTELTDALTITRLALNIFFKNYYDIENKPIPLINKLFLFSFIK